MARIEEVRLIPWGSNYTFLAVLAHQDGTGGLAIYKPRRGEAPLRDFPTGTLYKREIAAYVFALEIGWPIVPPTVEREDGPHGVGSLQLYVETSGSPAAMYEQIRKQHGDQLQRLALFDLLANNADRKGGHCLLDDGGRVWGIDHGLTFHWAPKLRTIIWDFCGEAIAPDLVRHLAAVRADALRVSAIQAALRPWLSDAEVEAVFQRWDRILDDPCFPVLDQYRNVPWPPF